MLSQEYPQVTEVVSYLTGGRKRDLSDKYDWIKVNPFYSPNQIILNEEGQRAVRFS